MEDSLKDTTYLAKLYGRTMLVKTFTATRNRYSRNELFNQGVLTQEEKTFSCKPIKLSSGALIETNFRRVFHSPEVPTLTGISAHFDMPVN